MKWKDLGTWTLCLSQYCEGTPIHKNKKNDGLGERHNECSWEWRYCVDKLNYDKEIHQT